jgi:hypothetical protein
LKYPLDKWAEEVRRVRDQFAKTNALPGRTSALNWKEY